MKKVCFFTGSRAEYGLLKPLMQDIKKDNELNLQILVSGMHLSSEFGYTYKEIESDGFKIDEKIEILLSSDSPIGLSKSLGLGMISFSEALDRLSPNLLVILGDRFEAFAVPIRAMLARDPIAHLHGGESTFGLIDEAIRHSITKMSSLHFVSTEEYRNRVIQLGEHPGTVKNVGAIGLDGVRKLNLLSKQDLEKNLGFKFNKHNVIVTFHPVTLEYNTSERQFNALLQALDELKDTNIIFTKSNADIEGRLINKMIDEYVAINSSRAIVLNSMGRFRYLSAVKCVDAVVGNSSSGIIEAPSFNVPTLNIGNRQKGRIQADSIINCEPDFDSIKYGLAKIMKIGKQDVKNPYEQKNTVVNIKNHIKKYLDKDKLDLKKCFYDIKIQEYV